ncbi:MFS transporter, partial [Enterococcus faecalis]|nr:MFS transporter [Enterococcus faecalis]EME5419533.1 MFS transporter [Enterococcus faecalis]
IYIFLGIGFGMLNSPITITAIEGMPFSQSGTAAAIAVTCKQIGNSLGVALPSLLITKPITSSLTRTPFTNVWLLFGCCAIAIIFLSYLSNSPLAKKSLRRVRFYF